MTIPPRAVRLLVSVRDAEEACAALAGGADLIDIKEPHRGSLGAADASVWQEVLDRVDGRAPVSAALGELWEDGRESLAAASGGMAFVKIGLARMAGRDWMERWKTVLGAAPPSVASVAVCYADWRTALAPNIDEVLSAAEHVGAAAVLVDTYDKSRGDLFDHLERHELHSLAERVRESGMMLALGGSISSDRLAMACELRPDYVAVRGAVCRHGRSGTVDRRLVRQFAERLAVLSGKGNRENPAARNFRDLLDNQRIDSDIDA